MRNSKGKFWKDFAMIQEELLLKVVDELNKISIPYMVAGGIAVIFYGRPRLTHDFDIIVEISPDQAKKLAESFKEDFHVDEEAIQEAQKNPQEAFSEIYRFIYDKKKNDYA